MPTSLLQFPLKSITIAGKRVEASTPAYNNFLLALTQWVEGVVDDEACRAEFNIRDDTEWGKLVNDRDLNLHYTTQGVDG